MWLKKIPYYVFEFIIKPPLIAFLVKILYIGGKGCYEELVLAQTTWDILYSLFIINLFTNRTYIIIQIIITWLLGLLIGYFLVKRISLIFFPRTCKLYLKFNQSFFKAINKIRSATDKSLKNGLKENTNDTLERASNELSYNVNRRSIRQICNELNELNQITEIIATSNSPIHLWFTSEVIEYIVSQVKIALRRGIPITRYFFGFQSDISKFNLSVDDVDISLHNMIKYIHNNAVQLIHLNKEIAQVKEFLEKNKSPNYLKIIYNNGNEGGCKIYLFKYNPKDGTTSFMPVSNEELDYYNNLINVVVDFSQDSTISTHIN